MLNSAIRYLGFAATILMSGGAQSHTPDDGLFRAGFEPGLRIDGVVRAPTVLANARIEARTGGRTYTSHSDSSGGFQLVVEGREPTAFIELRAFGRGSQSHIAWSSALGRYDWLFTRSGGDGVLDADELAFVNAGPRTTAISANLRAYNGNSPITDQTTFDRAIRAYQTGHTSRLTYALALVAAGELALPAGAENTLHAIHELGFAQILNSDFLALTNPDTCTPPTSNWCQLRDALPIDPDTVPLRSVPTGVPWFDHFPFDGSIIGRPSIMLTGPDQAVIRGYTADEIPASVTTETDGTLTLHRPGDEPFFVQIQPGAWRYEQRPMRVRATEGPGGRLEIASSFDVHAISLHDPPQPDQFFPARFGFPLLQHDPLPAQFHADVPDLAGRTFLLPMPADPVAEQPWPGVYDVHFVQANGTGTTDRRGNSFAISVSGPDTLTIAYQHGTVELRFFNEEQPGIWRVAVRSLSGLADGIWQGLLLELDPPSEHFTPLNTPGSYRTRINGNVCDGPWRDLRDLEPFGLCSLFGWTLASGGGGQMLQAPSQPVQWLLTDTAPSARLLLDRYQSAGGAVINRRGWELVRREPGRIWVLENANFGAGDDPPPPVSFVPVQRLVPYDLVD